jgi:pyruvate dehydrogenase E1 component beta subunit
MSATLAYHAARARALSRELDADPSIFLIGGSVALPFNADDGLLERYADRVLWPPISEFAVSGLGIGAAMAGLRPFVPLSTASFMFYCWAPIVNEAPNIRYLSGGQTAAPVVFHVMGGSRRGGGPQHEHTPQAMLQNVPGLRVYAPGTPAGVDAALHEALAGGDPAVIVDHVLLAGHEGEVPDKPPPRVQPQLVRSGRDALIVGHSIMVQRALNAAAELVASGIEVSVLEVPLLSPLPEEDILAAVAGHRHVLLVDESRLPGSPATHLLAAIAREEPDVSTRLVCSLDAPAPFATHLLDEIVPTAARIAEAVRELVSR